jgi:hypothetical protein
MKPFSFVDFNKFYNKFEWSHPDIRQTFWTKEDNIYDYHLSTHVRTTLTLTTLWYQDTRIIQSYTNDDNNKSRKLTNYNFYRDNAHALGLLSYASYRSNQTTLIDALYYKANPPNFYNKNGTLKKGFWGALGRRLRSNTLRPSWVTQHMLNKAVDIARAATEDTVFNSIMDYLNDKNIPDWSYYQDFLTDAYHVHGSEKRVRLGPSSWVYIHRSTDPSNFGWHYDEDHDIWLQPNQIMYDGEVYNRDEIQLVECTTCGRESVSDLTIDGVCHRCLDHSFKVHNYSTRVESMLKFKATKVRPNTIYLGCELEYETINRNKAQLAVGKLMHGHALMKSDGSIRNGFEIVTCPATLDIHLQVFKSFFDNLPPDLKVEKNVGMHVHISRKPLSQLTLGKLTEFLNRLDNKKFIAHIAGRIDNNYARMDGSRTITYPIRNRHGGDRYNALNLNNNNTVEVRLFATPSNYKEFAMRLQFVQALVDYCSPAQSSLALKKQTHYEAFMMWLHQRSKMFPELSYHLKEFN